MLLRDGYSRLKNPPMVEVRPMTLAEIKALTPGQRAGFHGLYAIFFTRDDKAMWAMSRNKRRALAYGRQVQGEVRGMALPYGNGAWDAPTFRVCSDQLADYRL